MVQVKRRKAKIIKIGPVNIGGDHPIAIQSMLKVKSADVQAAIRQINELEKDGCEIIRLAVKDDADALAFKKIRPKVNIPLVADIHFDYRLALKAADSGADKIRLNPGNIYKKQEVKQVVSAAKANHIPIRVGLNSGSVVKKGKLKASAHLDIAGLMAREALAYIGIIEKSGFSDIVISLKASDIQDTLKAYRKISKSCGYPLHLGVTASGTPRLGAVKSSIGIGALLLEGIGDTIRVSLTAHPKEEVGLAKAILEVLGLRHFGPEIISCPTCGRCEVDLAGLVYSLEKKLSAIGYRPSAHPIKLAVMGCVVNGPGEARQADIGIAFGKKEGLLFKKGRPYKKAAYADCQDLLLKEFKKCIGQGH
ncbi:MAG: flavodoxin-dependent (E)-4-hydroxy-3-methylbut-2-enyl-diphosphate synthase [Candidatus Omnitrophica bacterium]|nr:flavodoxin-dependent (E)-4-hydroxy-3-methylbut-2-enyl-diphosphate synthase [Candidatus Omnitrophota bacterium]